LPTYSQPTENKEVTAKNCAISQPKAAKMMNVSERQVRNAAKLRREAAPEVVKQVERGEKTIHAAMPKRTSAKPQPRRKFWAKEPAQTADDKRWQEEKEVSADWWAKMPQAYRDITGEKMTGCMRIPAPFHHAVVLAMFLKQFAHQSEEVRNNLIAEVKLLAARIDELNK
jgi:hypothetical protein